MKKLLSVILTGGFVVCSLSGPALGGWPQTHILHATDVVVEGHFGYFVSFSGGRALIAAPLGDDSGTDSGAAYVFRNDGTSWVQEAKLLPSDHPAENLFASSVSICHGAAVIGAVYDDDNGTDAGAAYLFRYNGSSWTQEDKILAADGAPGDNFGVYTSISGDTTVIGARADDDNGDASGSAYVFRYNGSSWTQEAKILAADGAPGDTFGMSVSNFGDIAVIGAYGDDDNGNGSGSAYAFRYNGTNWVQDAKLLAGDGAEGDRFGVRVSVSGNLALIGADAADDNGTNSGAAYMYRYNGSNWVEDTKLLAPDGAEGDRFGHGVSVSGNMALVGAPYADHQGTDSGAAYLFRYDGSSWVLEATLLAADGSPGDRFSFGAVATSDGTALVGAYLDDDQADDSGTAYVFQFSPSSIGDLDYDGDVDLADFAVFLSVFTGPLP